MINKKTIEELARTALQHGNPYIAKSVQFQIDGVARYIYADAVRTKEELDEAYLDTARKDIKRGYDERMVGYYDKWYRYNHADEGRAYDMGVRYATTQSKCSDDYHIIECMA